MTKLCIGNYTVDIFIDHDYTSSSTDNVNKYDDVYVAADGYQCTTLIGIKVFQNDDIFRSALIGSGGGGTGIHQKAFVYDPDRITICCSDTVFCLSIPSLELLWQTQADSATCFEIFKHKTNYIIHGEFEITRLDYDGNIIWQQGGADIFTRLNSEKDDFMVTETYILATDWDNRKYKFDFDGSSI